MGAAVFKSIRFFVLPVVLICCSTAAATSAHAQFSGGTQGMMLENLRRQQEQVTNAGANQGYQPGQNNQSQNQRPPSQGNGHQGSTNNYFLQQPYGYGYGYGSGYNNGYGNFYGNPYFNGHIIYPPIVQGYHGAYGNYIDYNGFRGNDFNSGYSFPPAISVQPFPVRPPVQPQVRQQPPQQLQPPPKPKAGAPAAEDEITRRVAVLKPSTEAGRLRSDELIAEGDREFVAQQFRRAAGKYREAISKAPDYPPAHFRAGHAYIATGDYELAVTYFAMGFELARTIERPDFSLTDLYRGNDNAKDQHLEALADAVLRQPEDGGLLFLTGLTQHYDGHPLQARDYFRRAASVPGRHQPYAAMFIPKAK